MGGQVEGHRGPGAGSFYGRAGRAEFWGLMAINVAATVFFGAAPFIGPLLALPWMYGAMAVTTRRLHDMRRSGWWLVAPLAAGLPFIILLAVHSLLGMVDGNRPSQQDWTALLDALGVFWLACSAAFLIWLAFAPTTREPNCYGESDVLLA